MKTWLVLFLVAFVGIGAGTNSVEKPLASDKKVYIIPIREQIMPPLTYVVRRGVKEAMEAKADVLILDMNTPGGRLDTCREIIDILGQFKGETVTYINKDGYSAGAFIAVATKKIYMAPEGVVGAAAVIMLNPGGEGVAQMPETFEKKISSAVRAQVRASALKNGHNPAVIEAMIEKDKGLILEDVVDGVTNRVTIAKVGEILTLNNTEAEKEYGHPPKKLLSSGTVQNLDELVKVLGYANARQVHVKPTGTETLGTWLETISPLLLIIGIAGIYIEFKTPGFGLPGIIGITAFVLYFVSGYVAGFSGLEWMVVFLVGLALVALELFFFPGTLALGIIGSLLMLGAIVMALVDVYPAVPQAPQTGPIAWPALPDLALADFNRALSVLGIAMVGTIALIWVLSKFMPNTGLYRNLVSVSASGVTTVEALEQKQQAMVGATGVALSPLRPGGKAQFGEEIVDVISQGEMIDKGSRVRIIAFSGSDAVVEMV